MTVIHELPCRPDPDVVSAFVRRLFENIPASQAGLVELAWTSTREPHALNQARLFDLADLDSLAALACDLNSAPNRNIYLSAGLRRTGIPTDARSDDRDVVAVCAVKADCDAQGAYANAIAIFDRIGLPPSLVVVTGHHPYTRAQLWWLLDEPASDLALVRQIERAIAHRCGADSSICNPSRVMRLAGSVAWPVKKGRQVEMTALEVGCPDPYSIETIASRLRAAGAMAIEQPEPQILDFNTADAVLDLDTLIAAAAEQGRWHRNALLAVAHLLGRGTPPDVALELLTPRLQQPGYTYQQTRRDLLPMVQGAITRGLYHPYSAPDPPPEAPEQPKRDPFPLLAISDLHATPPPSWRVEGYLPQRGFGILFGPSGTFKSFIALDIALSVAHGVPWRGRNVTQGPVLYIAAEGTYGIANRVLVWIEHRGKDAPCAGFWLAPVAGNLLDPKFVAYVIDRLSALPEQPVLVIADTLARSFGGGDENSTKDMNTFVSSCDKIAASLDCFVLAIHHSGKDSDRGARGSSVLRAAADVEIKVTRDHGDMVATISVTKQKDAEETQPQSVRLIPVEIAHPQTGEIISSLLPTLDDTDSEPRLSRAQRQVLALLEVGPGNLATLTQRSGKDRSNLRRTLNELVKANLAQIDDDHVYSLVVSCGQN